MATIEWSVKGREFANCNCSYGCPCQFNALPTHGFCEAAVGFQFDEGHFGDVRLDGLRAGAIYQWPGPVHLGNGAMQLIIDERADARQRDALTKIMSGQETNDGATMWWVFAAMCSTQHPPLFLPIKLEIDVDGRTGHLVVQGVVESSGEPIRNPVTGLPHRARINLPNGFEYRIAEIGSGRTRASGRIELDLKDTYAQFANIHLSHKGVVEGATA
jgi:hypothetical protein